jgi:hypothetical protein
MLERADIELVGIFQRDFSLVGNGFRHLRLIVMHSYDMMPAGPLCARSECIKTSDAAVERESRQVVDVPSSSTAKARTEHIISASRPRADVSALEKTLQKPMALTILHAGPFEIIGPVYLRRTLRPVAWPIRALEAQ